MKGGSLRSYLRWNPGAYGSFGLTFKSLQANFCSCVQIWALSSKFVQRGRDRPRNQCSTFRTFNGRMVVQPSQADRKSPASRTTGYLTCDRDPDKHVKIARRPEESRTNRFESQEMIENRRLPRWPAVSRGDQRTAACPTSVREMYVKVDRGYVQRAHRGILARTRYSLFKLEA